MTSENADLQLPSHEEVLGFKNSAGFGLLAESYPGDGDDVPRKADLSVKKREIPDDIDDPLQTQAWDESAKIDLQAETAAKDEASIFTRGQLEAITNAVIIALKKEKVIPPSESKNLKMSLISEMENQRGLDSSNELYGHVIAHLRGMAVVTTDYAKGVRDIVRICKNITLGKVVSENSMAIQEVMRMLPALRTSQDACLDSVSSLAKAVLASKEVEKKQDRTEEWAQITSSTTLPPRRNPFDVACDEAGEPEASSWQGLRNRLVTRLLEGQDLPSMTYASVRLMWKDIGNKIEAFILAVFSPENRNKYASLLSDTESRKALAKRGVLHLDKYPDPLLKAAVLAIARGSNEGVINQLEAISVHKIIM